ncbi:sulfotransferase family protein [uncultured Nocardioides sp.]|uniref:sulfotransferase family protein n=1 Tax=uncultured Nocardioides sp. TaxID=198441 RepID=UPI002603A683|nr:sulfotransferase family protein [uncultured Nocardioides sp.]
MSDTEDRPQQPAADPVGGPPAAGPAGDSAGEVAGDAEATAALRKRLRYPRRVVLVAGAGRSGTSTLAGVLQRLHLHVPQPEVDADTTNPRGFGESAWVVRHHERMLRRANVNMADARPDAWLDTARVAAMPNCRVPTSKFLEEQFGFSSEVVIKDPRLSWFLGLWQAAAVRTESTAVVVTMLRPPAEVIGSKQDHYSNRLGAPHLAASWLNMMLHTERAGRDLQEGGGRSFVRYTDLLTDWTSTVMRLGEELQLQNVLHAGTTAVTDVDSFIDPALRRTERTLAGTPISAAMRELVEETDAALNSMADPGGDTAEVRATLDQLRTAFVDLYADAEAVARSTAMAAVERGRREGREAARAEVGPVPAADDEGGATGLARRAARRLPEPVKGRLRDLRNRG